jgi:hypothetical protein
MSDVIHDLLLPETDRGTVTQWVSAGLVWTVVLIVTRG